MSANPAAASHETTDRLATAAHAAVDRAADTLRPAEERARAAAAEAGVRAHDAADRARSEGEKLVASLKDYTSQHPIASLGIAFAAGVVLASIIRR